MIKTIQPVRTNHFQILRFGSEKKSLESERTRLATLQAEKAQHEKVLSGIQKYETIEGTDAQDKAGTAVGVGTIATSTAIGAAVGGPVGALGGFILGLASSAFTGEIARDMTPTRKKTIETPDWSEKNEQITVIQAKITPLETTIAEADKFLKDWNGSDTNSIAELPTIDQAKLIADLGKGINSPFAEVSAFATAKLNEIESSRRAQKRQKAYEYARDIEAERIRGQQAAAAAAIEKAARANRAIQSDLDGYRWSAKNGTGVGHRMTAISNFIKREPDMDSNLRQSRALLTELLSDSDKQIGHYVVRLMDQEPKLRSILYEAAVARRDAELQAEANAKEVEARQKAAESRLSQIHSRLKKIDPDAVSKAVTEEMVGNPQLAEKLRPWLIQYVSAVGDAETKTGGLFLYTQGDAGIGKNRVMNQIAQEALEPHSMVYLNLRDHRTEESVKRTLAQHDTHTSTSQIGLSGKFIFFDELHALNEISAEERNKLIHFLCLVYGKTPIDRFNFRDTIVATASNEPIETMEGLQNTNGKALVSRIKAHAKKIALTTDLRPHVEDVVEKFGEQNLYQPDFPQLERIYITDSAKAHLKQKMRATFPINGHPSTGRDIVGELANHIMDSLAGQPGLEIVKGSPLFVDIDDNTGKLTAQNFKPGTDEELIEAAQEGLLDILLKGRRGS